MVYSPIDPDALLPGAKIIASLPLQTRDNPLAVAAGLLSVPLSSTVDLGKALRTAETNPTNVVKALGAGVIGWGAAPSIQTEQRTALGAGNWVVPAGVTEIDVQVWGGGGGNINISPTPGPALYIQGNSGAHVRAVLGVVPGETLTYFVGAGGAYRDASPGDISGGISFIRNAADTIYARAGGGDSLNAIAVASVAGFTGNIILMNGAAGKTTAGQSPNGAMRRAAPLAWGNYGKGGNTGLPGGQGYLRWRYVLP